MVGVPVLVMLALLGAADAQPSMNVTIVGLPPGPVVARAGQTHAADFGVKVQASGFYCTQPGEMVIDLAVSTAGGAPEGVTPAVDPPNLTFRVENGVYGLQAPAITVMQVPPAYNGSAQATLRVTSPPELERATLNFSVNASYAGGKPGPGCSGDLPPASDTKEHRVTLLKALGSGVDRIEVVNASLPTGRCCTSAVWDGRYAYVFGGYDGSSLLNQIVRYDPTTATVALMAAVLPSPRDRTSAVWDGQYAYVLGGEAGSGRTDRIIRYDPATDIISIMSAALPSPRDRTSAVWDGRYAYTFGGQDEKGYLNQIVRYHPASDTITVMNATLPAGRDATSAVWEGQYAYIFGGGGAKAFPNQIVRYHPATDNITVMNATLPARRCCTSAVWDGQHAYIFGGHDGSSPSNQIVRYNPATDVVSIMSTTLPVPRSWTSAVWGGKSAYVFGGRPQDAFTAKIVHYSPTPLPLTEPREQPLQATEETRGEAASTPSIAGPAPGPSVPILGGALPFILVAGIVAAGLTTVAVTRRRPQGRLAARVKQAARLYRSRPEAGQRELDRIARESQEAFRKGKVSERRLARLHLRIAKAGAQLGPPVRPLAPGRPMPREAAATPRAVPGPTKPLDERYRFVASLPQGSFGQARVMEDTQLGRKVVVKTLHPQWQLDPKVRAAFLREARIAGQLNDPHIVTVHDIDAARNAIVMEYVDGGSVEERLRRGPLPVAEALRLCDEVLQGLERVHALGVYHRDLKPANILLTRDGHAKIADFGIAHVPADATMARFSATGYQPGTLLYMAPEQVLNQPPDARTDLYAVAAMLYEMLTGKHYLGGIKLTDFELRRAVVEREPPLDAQLPGTLRDALRRGLAKRREDRFPDAAAMRRALAEARRELRLLP